MCDCVQVNNTQAPQLGVVDRADRTDEHLRTTLWNFLSSNLRVNATQKLVEVSLRQRIVSNPAILEASPALGIARKFSQDAECGRYDCSLSTFVDDPWMSLATDLVREQTQACGAALPNNYLAIWAPLQATRGLLRAHFQSIADVCRGAPPLNLPVMHPSGVLYHCPLMV